MSPLIRNFNRAQLNMQVLNRVTSSLHTGVYQFSSLPSNVEELAAKEKVAFSSNRFRDLSKGVVQSQTVSVFGTSCMNNQMSKLDAGNARQVQSATNHLENYDSTGAISLSAAMRDNIPQPFAPVIDKTLTPNLSMPTGPTGQQNKYIASDMQETLHSGFERLQDIQKPKVD